MTTEEMKKEALKTKLSFDAILMTGTAFADMMTDLLEAYKFWIMYGSEPDTTNWSHEKKELFNLMKEQ